VEDPAAVARALADVGPRLRRVRDERGVTLAQLAEDTGISTSTLSRLENGRRRPSLELLLPIAQAHQVSLDELVGSPDAVDPRVRFAERTLHGRTVVPLTRHAGSLQAWKMTIPPDDGEPEQKVHEGYEWLYVLSGRLRLIISGRDLVMHPGEAAEFDTRMPHWFGSADGQPVEVLSLFGRQGERMHVRARPRPRVGDGEEHQD
jgi:transcriptional regulator with XRE-family HTH domain